MATAVESRMLPIHKIRRDGGTQMRAEIDEQVVWDYRDKMMVEVEFPPILVFYDGKNYWLADGFHRIEGRLQAGFDDISCDIRPGTQEEAQWHACAANKTNGLHRTNPDKKRAVVAALQHPRGASLSDKQLAEHVGVSTPTVSKYRSELEASLKILKMETRTVTRGGVTYEQNTANIGRTRTAAAFDDVSAVEESELADDEEDDSDDYEFVPEEDIEDEPEVPVKSARKPDKLITAAIQAVAAIERAIAKRERATPVIRKEGLERLKTARLLISKCSSLL